MKLTNLLQKLALSTAVAMSAFAGILATTGLATFLPGARTAVLVMGALFEVAQLVAFAFIHRHWNHMPAGLRVGLGALACVVVVLDVVGVSGQLSSSYQERVSAGQATAVAAKAEADAKVAAVQEEIADLDRQIATVDANTGRAADAMGKARGDRDQIKAVRTMATDAEAKRATLTAKRTDAVRRLAEARTEAGRSAASQVTGAGEFAAIQFLSSTFGVDQDQIARIVILVISALPNLFAVALVMAADLGTPVPVVVPVPAAAPAQAPAAAPAPVKKPATTKSAAKPTKDPKRVKAAIKAAATRKRNAAARKAAGQLHVVTA